MKIISYFLQSFLIYLFFLIGRILGLKISRRLFSFLFVYVGPIFKSKKIIENNLNIFSNKNPNTNIKKIQNNMWENYGKTFIEYIFLNYFKKRNTHIKFENEDIFTKIKNNNKPVIFVSGHFANYELMSMEITKRNIPLATIYRPLNNIFLNPFMEILRRRYVCSNQIKKGINGVRQAIEFLKKKHSIALMIDQRVSEGKKIHFFDKLALTTTLPAQLSIKYNLEIIPVYIERLQDEKFIIEFQKPLQPNNFENKIDLTCELNKVLEKMVIRNPGQWIWTHNRWK